MMERSLSVGFRNEIAEIKAMLARMQEAGDCLRTTDKALQRCDS